MGCERSRHATSPCRFPHGGQAERAGLMNVEIKMTEEARRPKSQEPASCFFFRVKKFNSKNANIFFLVIF
jgi:hypothetical protein